MVAKFFSRGLSTNDHRHGNDENRHAKSHVECLLKSQQNHGVFVLICL